MSVLLAGRRPPMPLWEVARNASDASKSPRFFRVVPTNLNREPKGFHSLRSQARFKVEGDNEA